MTDIKVAQALPLIKEALGAGQVDESRIRWHFVQHEFGLISDEEYEQLDAEYIAALRASNNGTKLTPADFRTSLNNNVSPAAKKQKAKAKRKMAKAFQKKNPKKNRQRLCANRLAGSDEPAGPA